MLLRHHIPHSKLQKTKLKCQEGGKNASDIGAEFELPTTTLNASALAAPRHPHHQPP